MQIRPLVPADIVEITVLQQQYAQVYPGAAVVPGEVYLSPGFKHGANVFCAFDADGRLRGYAPVYPVGREVWAEIKVDPRLDGGEPIKDALLDYVLDCARQEASGTPVRLTFQYYPSEAASIAYVCARGCTYRESIFQMTRDLAQDIPVISPPVGVEVRRWRMPLADDQRAYVDARNDAFPEAPVALAEWQYFLQSPEWQVGTTITAFDGPEIAGSAAAFWSETANQAPARKVGFTEYIFVREAWRRRGIATYLVREALAYLKEYGLDEAHLDVRAQNSQALNLYYSLGYQVVRESQLFVRELVS